MAWRIGVDTGGTCTDVALVGESSGRIRTVKALTMPKDFAQGVLDGTRKRLSENTIDPAEGILMSHVTTVVTNALPEHQGGQCGSSPRAGSAT